MARAQNKEELIQQSSAKFDVLFSLIDSISMEEQEREFAFDDRDRNVKDVLVHLYEWQQLQLTWIEQNLNGKLVNFLPGKYNWKTYPAMNLEIQSKHQMTSLKEAKTLLQSSHEKLLELAQQFSNEELFTKKYYTWTGTTNLGSYFVSNMPSHYDWAVKKIKKHIKMKRS